MKNKTGLTGLQNAGSARGLRKETDRDGRANKAAARAQMSCRLVSAVMAAACMLCIAAGVSAQEFPPNIFQAFEQKAESGPLVRTMHSGSARGEINYEKNMIMVSAYGAANRAETLNIADEKKQAADAAYLAAIEKVAEIILGVRVAGERSLDNFKTDGMIQQSIRGFLRSVQHFYEFDTFETMPDGSILAQVTVGARLYGADGLISATILKPMTGSEPNPIRASYTEELNSYKEVHKPPPPPRVEKDYTGIIIDCREMEIQPDVCVAPRIVTTDDKRVYGVENVPRNIMLNGGIVGYARSLDSQSAKNKAGDNPLIIKPQGLAKQNTHIVVSQTDANQMLWLDQNHKVLEKAQVVMLF